MNKSCNMTGEGKVTRKRNTDTNCLPNNDNIWREIIINNSNYKQ